MPLCWADDDPLDQTVIDDITKAVPGLKLKRSYGKGSISARFKICFLDFALPSHMLEIYDFPKSVRTGDLLAVSFITTDSILAIFRRSKNNIAAFRSGGSTTHMQLLFLLRQHR